MLLQRKRHLSVCNAVSNVLFGMPAIALDFDFYGSLRIQAETVNLDVDVFDSYAGFRDAYSRICFNAAHALSQDVTGCAKFELPFDTANLAVQDPWNQSEDIRVAKLGIKGSFGDLSVGHMWMPYYNPIAYPVDMFSSYYSSFATFTRFRLGDTVSYYTPSLAGFSGAVAYSYENGAAESGGVNDARICGGSLMWQAADALHIGAKYEQHDSDIVSGYGADGDIAANLYAGYAIGKNTLKAMVADVDNYGEQIIRLGVDHQYTKSLRFFAEYYIEEEAAAIVEKHKGGYCGACEGGSVVTAGLRYDFGAP